MFQPGSRTVFRTASTLRAPISRSFPTFGRRFASTAPADQPRSWKSSVARWGVVIAGLYYYNTSKMFAEEPAPAVQLPATDREAERMPTVDELAAQRRQQTSAKQSVSTSTVSSDQAAIAEQTSDVGPSAGSPQELEEEAEGEGAFNPETGEINWDCPCLGGMAHGPCGDQFKAAFSCFVYSKEEPKGVDCIENFKNMQDCFRQYPDVYGAELADDEGDEDLGQKPALHEQSGPDVEEGKATVAPAQAVAVASAPSADEASSTAPQISEQTPTSPDLTPEEIRQKRQRAKSAAQQVKSERPVIDETEEAVPKAWHDTRPDPHAK